MNYGRFFDEIFSLIFISLFIFLLYKYVIPFLARAITMFVLTQKWIHAISVRFLNRLKANVRATLGLKKEEEDAKKEKAKAEAE